MSIERESNVASNVASNAAVEKKIESKHCLKHCFKQEWAHPESQKLQEDRVTIAQQEDRVTIAQQEDRIVVTTDESGNVVSSNCTGGNGLCSRDNYGTFSGYDKSSYGYDVVLSTNEYISLANDQPGRYENAPAHQYISLANNDLYSNFACHLPAIIVFGTMSLYVGVIIYDYRNHTAWFLHLFFFLGCWIGVWLLYMSTGAIVGIWKMRRCCEIDWEKELERMTNKDNNDSEKKIDLTGVLHFVILPHYNEDEDMISVTLNNFASNLNLAKQRMIVVLACEAREGETVRGKAKRLIAKHNHQFRDMIASFHPAGLPNEVKGKSSNTQWAFREIQKYHATTMMNHQMMVSSEVSSESTMMMVSSDFTDLSKIFLHICDADNLFHKHYFSKFEILALSEQNAEQRTWSIYQTPIPQYRNIEKGSSFVRNGTYGCCMYELSGLASSNVLEHFSYSCYSLTLALLNHPYVDGWDTDVIAEDNHTFIKCLCADYWENLKNFSQNYSSQSSNHLPLLVSRLRIEPIWLPTNCYMIEDSSVNVDVDDLMEWQVALNSNDQHGAQNSNATTKITCNAGNAERCNAVNPENCDALCAGICTGNPENCNVGNVVASGKVACGVNAALHAHDDAALNAELELQAPTNESYSFRTLPTMLLIQTKIVSTSAKNLPSNLFNRLMCYSPAARKLNRRRKFTLNNLRARYVQGVRHIHGLAEFSYIVLQYFSIMKAVSNNNADINANNSNRRIRLPLSFHWQFIHMGVKYITPPMLNSIYTLLLILVGVTTNVYITIRVMEKFHHREGASSSEVASSSSEVALVYIFLDVLKEIGNYLFSLRAQYYLLNVMITFNAIFFPAATFFVYISNWLALKDALEGRFYDLHTTNMDDYDESCYTDYKYQKYHVDKYGNHSLISKGSSDNSYSSDNSLKEVNIQSPCLLKEVESPSVVGTVSYDYNTLLKKLESPSTSRMASSIESTSGTVVSYRDETRGEKIIMTKNTSVVLSTNTRGWDENHQSCAADEHLVLEKLSTRKMKWRMQAWLLIRIYMELTLLGQISLMFFSIIPMFQCVVGLSINGHRFDYVVGAKPTDKKDKNENPVEAKPSDGNAMAKKNAIANHGNDNVSSNENGHETLRKSSKEVSSMEVAISIESTSKEGAFEASCLVPSSSACSTVAIYASRIRRHAVLINDNNKESNPNQVDTNRNHADCNPNPTTEYISKQVEHDPNQAEHNSSISTATPPEQGMGVSIEEAQPQQLIRSEQDAHQCVQDAKSVDVGKALTVEQKTAANSDRPAVVAECVTGKQNALRVEQKAMGDCVTVEQNAVA